jgi:hypothetical protein
MENRTPNTCVVDCLASRLAHKLQTLQSSIVTNLFVCTRSNTRYQLPSVGEASSFLELLAAIAFGVDVGIRVRICG